MSISEPFQQNFEENLKSELSGLESLRKKLLFKIGFIYALCISVSGFAFFYLLIKMYRMVENDDEVWKIMLVGGVLLLAFAITFLYKVNQKITRNYFYNGGYATRYKKEIIGKAIPMKFEGLEYDSENGISETEFAESGFPMFENVERYYASGRITGEIDKTSFAFSEVLAEEYQKGKADEMGHYEALFQGMFFIVDLKKQITENTLVYPDMMKYFKSAIFSNENLKYKRVKLEDLEFEKYFEVYGTDQTESRYVLSTALMSRMVDFRKNTKKYIQLSFKDSKAYIGVFLPGKDLSKPPLFSSVYDSEHLEDYFANVRLMTDIIKELNLNSRLSQS